VARVDLARGVPVQVKIGDFLSAALHDRHSGVNFVLGGHLLAAVVHVRQLLHIRVVVTNHEEADCECTECNLDRNNLGLANFGVHAKSGEGYGLLLVHNLGELEIQLGHLVVVEVGSETHVHGLASIRNIPLGVVVHLLRDHAHVLAEGLALLEGRELE